MTSPKPPALRSADRSADLSARLLAGAGAVCALCSGACLDDSGSGDEVGATLERVTPTVEDGYPILDGPCRGDPLAPTHLVVTSTDFNTGAVGLVDLATREVDADLALASSDALPVVLDGRVFVVNRYGFDWIDELAPDDLGLVHEFAVEASPPASASANPHDLSLAPDGESAWVTLFGSGEVQRVRFPSLAFASPHADLAVDMGAFADADQNPELDLAIGCGSDLLFVSAERLDRSTWTPADETLLVPLRTADQPALFEFRGDHPGPDGIPLLGTGVGAWRFPPGDTSGQVIVMLNSGLERVDLGAGTSQWLVPQTVFAAAGMTRLHLSGFDYDSLGRIWLSVAEPDYAAFGLWRVDLDGPEAVLVPEVENLHSVTGDLELVADLAYFADTTLGASGLRVFDLAQSPVSELPGSPLAVGLPPMNISPM